MSLILIAGAVLLFLWLRARWHGRQYGQAFSLTTMHRSRRGQMRAAQRSRMLAGSLPFLGKTLADILAAHRTAAVPRLPEAMSAYQPITDRLLAKDPKDRYASAADFLDALDALRAELMIRKPSKSQRSA